VGVSILDAGMGNLFVLDDIVRGLGTFVAQLSPAATASITNFVSILLLVILSAIALVLACFFVYIASAVAASRSASGDAFAVDEIIADLGRFAATAAVPILTAFGTLFSFAASAATTALTYSREIAIGLFFAAASALVVVYAPELVATSASVYAALSFVWSLVMYGVLVLVQLFNIIYPFINFLVVRLPSALTVGFFTDLATCSATTFQALLVSITNILIQIGAAWTAWTSSGAAQLTVVPDFGPTALALGQTIGLVSVFFNCTCTSGSGVLVAPILEAVAVGPPLPLVAEPLPPFAVAVNATVTLVPAALTDIVRPFYVIINGIVARDTFFDIMDDAHVTFNGTVATAINVVNGTLGLGTNLVQQYWVAVGRALTLGYVPGIDFPAPPPVLFECLTGVLAAPLHYINTVVNTVARPRFSFTTFNGQLAWMCRCRARRARTLVAVSRRMRARSRRALPMPIAPLCPPRALVQRFATIARAAPSYRARRMPIVVSVSLTWARARRALGARMRASARARARARITPAPSSARPLH
jgi:hypothetical protein